MKLKTYLNEEWDYKSPEYKLFMRYMDVRNKADKLASQMSKMDTELSKIQKQMKKNNMDELLNHKDQVVFTLRDDTMDAVRNMIIDR